MSCSCVNNVKRSSALLIRNMKLFQELKDLGVKVTGSYADGTQYESSWFFKGHEREKGMSDIDFQVPEKKLNAVKELLKRFKIEIKDESDEGMITVGTYPAFDFSTKFYPRKNKLPHVEIFGVTFETH